jgi:hypothetical protein
MSQWSGQGMGTYEKRLKTARDQGIVGVHHHMHRPTEPTSLMGYKGKRPNNKTLELTAEKLQLAAKTNPGLQAAADNAARLLSIAKAGDKAKETAKKATQAPKATVSKNEAAELQVMIDQLKAAQATPTPKANAEVPKPQPPPLPKAQAEARTFDPDVLRKKAKAEHLKRIADSLQVPQYGAGGQWGKDIKLSNKAG